MTGNPLGLFRKFFGAVRANFWLCGSFLAPENCCESPKGQQGQIGTDESKLGNPIP